MVATTPPFNKQRRKALQQFAQRNNPSDTPGNKTPGNLSKKPGLPGRRRFPNNAPYARY